MGEYIGFVDADDYVSLSMYEATQNNNLPDIITTSLNFVNDDSFAFKKYDSKLN